MQKFLIRIGIALSLVIVIHAATAVFFANGRIDNYYLRFTTPAQHALVLGNSRAAQGVVPHVIESIVPKDEFEGPLYNYSFTLSTSPYGPYYLECIKKKLLPETKQGLFILCVDPWSISRNAYAEKDDPEKFDERFTIPYKIKIQDQKPNIEYLLKSFNAGWGDMIISNTVRTNATEVQDNGWLTVNIKMDKQDAAKREADKVRRYKEEVFYAKTYSPIRLDYLRQTIDLLKAHGTVYLVRVPVSDPMLEVEKQYLPKFDSLIEICAREKGVSYFNYTLAGKQKYLYTDGNHLFRDDAIKFSKVLAEDIQSRSHGKGVLNNEKTEEK